MNNRITNEQREAIVREAIAKRDALLSGPMTEENAGQRIAEMLMECAERLGNFPQAKVDPRAWQHLLVYAPAGVSEADECGTCRKALPDGCNTEFQGEQSCALTHGVGVGAPAQPSRAALDAAWQAFESHPVDHAEDHDDQQRLCVEAAVRATYGVPERYGDRTKSTEWNEGFTAGRLAGLADNHVTGPEVAALLIEGEAMAVSRAADAGVPPSQGGRDA